MAEFFIHGELADFLPLSRRGRALRRLLAAHESAKHALESLGVPHTEVGELWVDGEPATLSCRPGPDQRVDVLAVCPRPAPFPGEALRFIADAHLGRLARYLRFAGIDTLWSNAWDDAELVTIAGDQRRVALTRDRALLMHRALGAGCYLRTTRPLPQLAEVASRYAIDLRAGRPSLCLECNVLPEPIASELVADSLPRRTRAAFAEFWRCPCCARIYWRGSHWLRMRSRVEALAVSLEGGRSPPC
ncbi:Mut7-C RNAse domain-containing protein [Accumulibacter sp.]|uniref:Mut7-C RNAse domain-containing protein n=1 Tax=Accumulibacter sp. TaxID=2053492 RepID=UPI0025FA0168|nr:Mut7-C RNAse domain-containing protein [Accumulibacter sp.]MCM8594556.1 Mut7-C ubiquitin/RNAse domain-containing protein [Accumulibacter sp.]MCM8627404.1 Mut7-C ubiquitin/RNAse domain-containing protein [Accumulibacter sp.]MDS4048702.1 Mut7-C RNAse domain-containing protein [Accumulibacter sp.]